jgi:MFS family permease
MSKNETGQSVRAKPRFFYGYTVLIACLIINMCVMAIFFSVGVFFKPMLNEFGWSRAVTSGPISLSWVISGLLGIAVGGLNDRLGPKIVVTICGLLFGIGCLLMSQINSTWQIYLYYGVLIGAGSSLPIPLMSTVSRWFVKRRTVMTGMLMLGSGIGGMIMPPLANWLILNHGWRISYLIIGGVLLVVVFIAAQFLKRDPSQINQVPYGANEAAGEKSRVNTQGLSLKKALNTRQFWLIFTLFFCFSVGVNTVIVHLVPHITDLGISPTIAATFLVATNAAGIVGRVGLGGLGDRLGNKRLFLMTFTLLIIGFSGFVFIKDLWLFYPFVLIYGLGYGSGLTQESPIVANMFGLSSHGLVFGVASLGHTMGAAAGTLLGGYLYDISGSYQLTFIICVIASIVGLGLVLGLTPIRKSIEKADTAGFNKGL